MLTQSLTAIILFISITTVAPITVNAQSAHRFEIDIPFSFVLKGRTVSAGKYAVERTDPSRADILTLRNVHKGTVQLVLTQRVEMEKPSAASSLVFIKREGKLYLFQVWNVGAVNGNQLPTAFEKTSDQPRKNLELVTLRARVE